MELTDLVECLYAFALAGRPGFRSPRRQDWRQRIEELRAEVRPALSPTASIDVIDDLVERTIDDAINRTLADLVDPRSGVIADQLFARVADSVGANITSRRARVAQQLVLSDPRSLRSRHGQPGAEHRLIEAVAVRIRWPSLSPSDSDWRSHPPAAPDLEAPPMVGEAHLGRLRNAWLTLAVGPFAPPNLYLTAVDEEVVLPPAIEAARQSFAEAVASRSVGHHRPVDNDCLALRAFDVSERTRNHELPILRLEFCRTSYFRGRVTNWQLDRPTMLDGRQTTLRTAVVAQHDLRVSPAPSLANIWGIILTIVTSDAWVLVPLRGQTEVEANCFGPSVGEEGLWSRDVLDGGTIDPFRIAAAGVEEELGITLEPRHLQWLEFGANTVCCRYALVGLVNIDLTRSELQSAMSTNAKDAWEIRAPAWARFAPESVAAFMSEPGRRFSPYATAALTRALLQKFGWSRCASAFANAEIDVVRSTLRL